MDQHTGATPVDPVSLLPIDITYSKLAGSFMSFCVFAGNNLE
jgi:hypothetical protein